MKYVTPRYEQAAMATEDIITTSGAQSDSYEIEQNNDGSGSVIMNAFNLFK